MVTRKILMPILTVLALVMSIFGILSFDGGMVSASSETSFLVESKKLSYISNTEALDYGLWKTEEGGDGYIARWSTTFVSPGVSTALAMVFTAPDTATISEIIIYAYNANAVTEQNQNDGARIALFKNNQKIYPTGADVFKSVSDDSSKPTVVEDISNISLVAGDKLYFVVENGGNGNNSSDSVAYDFTCTYQDTVSEPVTLSLTQNLTYSDPTEMNKLSGIGEYTKAELMSYAVFNVRSSVDMGTIAENDTEVVLIDKEKLTWLENETFKYWCSSEEKAPYLGLDASLSGKELVPSNNTSVAIEFTAPTDGTISNKFGLGSFRKLNAEKGTSDCAENDLARFSVIKDNKVIYPSENVWENVPFADQEFKQIKFNSFEIKAGEKLYYVVENGGNANNSYDNVLLKDLGFLWIDENNPNGVWFDFYNNYYTTDVDTESSIRGYKKSEVISYTSIASVEPPIPEAVEITKKEVEPIKESLITEMTFNTQHTELGIRSAPNLLVRADCCQPSELYMLALQWTAPKTGRLRISSSYINNFNYKTESQIVDGSISDGVRVKVILNNKYQIFPAGEKEWETTSGTENLYVDVDTFAVEAGDTVLFIMQVNKKEAYDTSVLQLVYDFAEPNTGFTERYNSYDATAEMFATPDGSLDDTPWRYFAIEILNNVDRYFGGNTYELPLIPVKLADYTGLIIGVAAGVVSVTAITIAVVVIIRKRRLGK